MSEADRAKWNARHTAIGEPSASVVSLEDYLPKAGRALDVAGGAGRHALWLARRGLEVTLVDISDAGLALVRGAGAGVQTLALDLDDQPLPAGPWDVILCAFFMDRRVYATLPGLLAPGGTLVVVQPTRRNLERHAQPSAQFLLEPGELLALGRGLEVLHFDEDWSVSDRHEARLVARRLS